MTPSPGTLVRAEGNTKIMIVTDISGGNVTCVWYRKRRLIRLQFPVSELRVVEGTDNYRSFS